MGLRFVELALMLLALGLQYRISSRHRGRSVFAGGWFRYASYTILIAGALLCSYRISFIFPDWSVWVRALTLVWALSVLGLAAVLEMLRAAPAFSPGRRRVLEAAQAAVFAAPVAVTGLGILAGDEFRIKEVSLPIAGLPQDLDGVTIVQLSDIHLSPFLDERKLERVIDMANSAGADLAVMTGDLITGPKDPLDACIRQLARLRTPAGVIGCLGNHELHSDVEDYATAACARLGIPVLRSEARRLRFGSATLNIVGVDYQPKRKPYLTTTAGLVAPGHCNLLLSHNPDVFPVAAAQGFQVTLAGHTHGGQVNVEILERHVNIARFFTPYTYGVYQTPSSAIYVTRGIGTVGIPARIGAPPEVALIRLCSS